jgi:hypothetical protein
VSASRCLAETSGASSAPGGVSAPVGNTVVHQAVRTGGGAGSHELRDAEVVQAPVTPSWVWTVLAVGVLTAAPVDYGARSCADLTAVRLRQAAGLAKLAEWMEHHCSGELKFTTPAASRAASR